MSSKHDFVPLNLGDDEEDDVTETLDQLGNYDEVKSRFDYTNLMSGFNYISFLVANSYKRGKLLGIFVFVLISIAACNWFLFTTNGETTIVLYHQYEYLCTVSLNLLYH